MRLGGRAVHASLATRAVLVVVELRLAQLVNLGLDLIVSLLQRDGVTLLDLELVVGLGERSNGLVLGELSLVERLGRGVLVLDCLLLALKSGRELVSAACSSEHLATRTNSP